MSPDRPTKSGSASWSADVSRALHEARNLPGFVYWDEEIYRSELALIFGGMWVCVGRHEDLLGDGSFVNVEIGSESVLVLRDAVGEIRAFYNTCRHRGTRLVDEPCGEGLLAITCPYHAWCYGLDGALRAAPRMEGDDGFRREDWNLVPLRLESWEGFLFVCFGGAPPPLDVALEDFPVIEGWGMADLRRCEQREYVVEANWKVICENYSECYHCPTVHPQLHKLTSLGSSRAPVAGKCFNGGPMDLRDGVETMSFTGESAARALPRLRPEDAALVHYYVLYPNLLLSLHPDYVMSHRLTPLDPERTRVVCEWYFEPGIAESDGFDPAEVIEFWDVVNVQDWELCRGVQRGSHSQGHRPGPYQSTEDCVYFFDCWWVDRMGLEGIDR